MAAFVEAAIFGPSRPHGVTVRLGSANGQPALAAYEPRPDNTLVASGLQVIDIDARSNTIVAITSFRNPEIAIRCGLPATITLE